MSAQRRINIIACACAFACIALLAICVLVGCAKQSPRAPVDYPHAYKALMFRYRDLVNTLTTRPFPPKSLPRQQRRLALAQQVKDVADAHAAYARELHTLNPPAEFMEVHRASEAMLSGEADDNYRWSEAVLHGNRAANNKLLGVIEANELRASKRLQDALKRAGGDSRELNSLVNELQQNKAAR
jgi:hypothetical protein